MSWIVEAEKIVTGLTPFPYLVGKTFGAPPIAAPYVQPLLPHAPVLPGWSDISKAILAGGAILGGVYLLQPVFAARYGLPKLPAL